ncbi:rec8 protein [Diaporthe amygdali]|uniref:rec8 protein n=1 Tax=Phomopsis amygdali TaxID=1214568 RepID=UPI0022FF3A65|nr:rec8 protein [Diaporthe amygdali]KAJ0123109.1 rec8 protein [Diaporthe amygdali]
MFYSHEILASPQYGVATVWLVANLGVYTTNRKLNRKAIESVNVPQACDTIEKPPGAPIALRLQGSLLYGVSGVYLKKHNYLLEDAEKVWTHMRAFYRSLQQSTSNGIDLKAGKAKRSQLILVDDPNFVPSFDLPPLDFDENGDLLFPGLDFSQRTKLSSQLSPIDRGSGSVVSPAAAPFINLNIRHSSSQESLGVPSPFGGRQQKPNDLDIEMAFGEEEVLPFADFGLTIDADGNLVEQPEPELPLHPQSGAVLGGEAEQKDGSALALLEDEAMFIPGDEDQIILGDDPFAEEAVVPAQQNAQNAQQDEVPLPSEELISSDEPQPPQQRKTRTIKRLGPDVATHVGREEFKSWSENYVARVEEARNVHHQVTAAQAKKNAYNFTFGMGVMGVGVLNNIPELNHPLAQFFAGDELKAIVMGDVEVQIEEEDEEQARSRRRRSASNAFEEEENVFNERRVRARLDEGEVEEQDPQLGRNEQEQDGQTIDDPMMIFGDDLPEIGREHHGSAMSDHRRSSNAPWNRPSSVIPSSTRSQKGREAGIIAVEGSPLVGRGSILPNDPRLNDGNMPSFGYDGLNPHLNDGANELSSLSEFGAAAGVSTQEANTSQFMRNALDREGRNFLNFVERVAGERGDRDEMEENGRWVEFDSLFEEQDKTKAVVAQAFLHILTLATKGQIKVKQEGIKEKIAYGEIRVGVTDPSVEQPKDAPEEMVGVEVEG